MFEHRQTVEPLFTSPDTLEQACESFGACLKKLLLQRLLLSHQTIHPRGCRMHPSQGACGREMLRQWHLHNTKSWCLTNQQIMYRLLRSTCLSSAGRLPCQLWGVVAGIAAFCFYPEHCRIAHTQGQRTGLPYTGHPSYVFLSLLL